MHETLAAHLFKALKLGKWIKVVVDAQIEIRPLLVTANHERHRLLSALVATSGLAGAHRGDIAGVRRLHVEQRDEATVDGSRGATRELLVDAPEPVGAPDLLDGQRAAAGVLAEESSAMLKSFFRARRS